MGDVAKRTIQGNVSTDYEYEGITENFLRGQLDAFRYGLKQDVKDILNAHMRDVTNRETTTSPHPVVEDKPGQKTTEKSDSHTSVLPRQIQEAINLSLSSHPYFASRFTESSQTILPKENVATRKRVSEKILFPLRCGVIVLGVLTMLFIGFFTGIAEKNYVIFSVALGVLSVAGYVLFSGSDNLWEQ